MKNPPVLVTWLDAYLDLDAQGTPAEVCIPSPEQRIRTLGFYLGLDTQNLYLALDLGPNDVRGLLRIPRAMILDIHMLGPLGLSTEKATSKSAREAASGSRLTSATGKRSNGSKPYSEGTSIDSLEKNRRSNGSGDGQRKASRTPRKSSKRPSRS